MRQAFISTPWVHGPAPPEIVRFFQRRGRWLRLPAGGAIFNGGDVGEIALVLAGLGAFSFRDLNGRSHIFAVLLPGRLMGDVDAVSGQSVNVIDTALRQTEVRLVRRGDFTEFLASRPDCQRAHSLGVIADHESDMEGMIANFTLPVARRLLAFFRALLVQTETPRAEWMPLPFDFRGTELSEIVSASRPTVSGVLSEWAASDLIRRQGRRILLSEELLRSDTDWLSGTAPAVRIRRSRRRGAPKG